ncbi:MAG: EVE domain-containing protein [Chromatiales bacterium 21-64-14]|nr:MAG: EVE domain-containing protein [Chromatiales bacterium 21-64-14]HQU16523.1 EVE domain-containing protein [Gammaproteobacteria bacterium]
MNYWLMKSEPSTFGIEDLRRAPRGVEPWDGVRNYQARNMIRDQMKRGDMAFFYHSSCAEPAIVGIMEIVREAYPDPTAFDRKNHHYDPESDPRQPRWYVVDVRYRRTLKRPVTLQEMKLLPQLADLPLVRRGNRLSIMPVAQPQWDLILGLAD